MPWFDCRSVKRTEEVSVSSEFREGGIVKARIVARRGVGYEAIDLSGKLAPTAAAEMRRGPAGSGEQTVGVFRSPMEAKKAIEAGWNYVDSELPGSD